jgi:hypothetical protein
MFLCPQDLQWCMRPECRTGSCELTGERPFVACIGCGSVTERHHTFRLCIECIEVELPADEMED